jgi:hypothetical protein
MLQAFRITRREADFDAGRQPHDDAVAAGVAMRAYGTRATHPRIPARLRLAKSSLVSSVMETPRCVRQLVMVVRIQPWQPASKVASLILPWLSQCQIGAGTLQ